MSRRFLVKLHWFLSSLFGIDFRRFLRTLRSLPRFIHDLWRFRKGHVGRLMLMPYLNDRFEENGTTKSEYFWQDLLVARWIHEAKPERHVDIGSRVDGFIAHVGSFREIEVLDIRPVSITVPGIVFKQMDMMDSNSLDPAYAGGYCDSLSCLHALEHFGLGRYGDPIDPVGYKHGIANSAALLKSGGTFYLSTPIGHERVEFNANWVFDPHTILECAKNNLLELKRLIVFSPDSGVVEIIPSEEALRDLAQAHYHLGLFVFTKSR